MSISPRQGAHFLHLLTHRTDAASKNATKVNGQEDKKGIEHFAEFIFHGYYHQLGNLHLERREKNRTGKRCS